MNDTIVHDIPEVYEDIVRVSKEIGFTMPSDIYVGMLLKTLIASKPNGRFLELGTGMGLSSSWMVDGMDQGSTLVSLDNDPKLIDIAESYFGQDKRIQFICEDGNKWLNEYEGKKFDLVFADAWPGKYSLLDETLALVKVRGYYVIDDMAAQPNWPPGHDKNVNGLVSYLESREDFVLTKMNWSTGVIIAVRIK